MVCSSLMCGQCLQLVAVDTVNGATTTAVAGRRWGESDPPAAHRLESLSHSTMPFLKLLLSHCLDVFDWMCKNLKGNVSGNRARPAAPF